MGENGGERKKGWDCNKKIFFAVTLVLLFFFEEKGGKKSPKLHVHVIHESET